MQSDGTVNRGAPLSAEALAAMPEHLASAWSESVRTLEPQAAVLVVDDHDVSRRLSVAILEREGFEALAVQNGFEALDLLERRLVDLVLLDQSMPGMDGLECCRRIRANRRTSLVPVLMVTSLRVEDHEDDAVAAGADELLSRPFTPETLRIRVRTMLRQKSVIDRLEEAESILFALATAVEQRDPCTSGHCERLAMYAVSLGTAMQLPHPQLLALYRGGYLHDIGKIGIPDSILFKPGPLNNQEWRVMKTHTLRGEEICRPMKCLQPVLPVIRGHHERWDGSGYPDGLRGDEIPLLARVMQIADVFDALTTERPYKAALTTREALRVMQHETDAGWHDPALVELFECLPHDLLRDTAHRDSTGWNSMDAMRNSLDRLRRAVG